jgi:hypothetical protein
MDAAQKLPVFDESVGVNWDACVGETCPGRVSGVPVLKKSRLPTDSIVSNYDSGESPEEIADVFEFPSILFAEYSTTPSQFRGRNSSSPRPCVRRL